MKKNEAVPFDTQKFLKEFDRAIHEPKKPAMANECKCETCNGSGEQMCASCSGCGTTGRPDDWNIIDPACFNCGGRGVTVCEICGGDGVVDVAWGMHQAARNLLDRWEEHEENACDFVELRDRVEAFEREHKK